MTTPVATSNEVQVNTYSTGPQDDPSITTLAGGGYVITWSSYQDGSGRGVYGQRYDSTGNTVGSEFLINTETTQNQDRSSVAALNDGGFIVTWTSGGGQDGNNAGVFAQRFDAAGATVGVEFQVNTHFSGIQENSVATGLGDGGYLVVWESYLQDGSFDGVYAQRYDSAGAASGIEFRINATILNSQREPAVTSLPDGGFFITWDSYLQDGNSDGIYGQRYDSAGNVSIAEFKINTTTANAQRHPEVTVLSDGSYVVIWTSYATAAQGGDGDGQGVFGQMFNAAGAAVGNEFQVNTSTLGYQNYSALTALSDGGFVAIWNMQNDGGTPNANGIFGQRFDAVGNKVGAEFSVESFAGATLDRDAAVTALDGGGFVVTWESLYQDGDNYGVFSRTFSYASTAFTAGDDVVTLLGAGLSVDALDGNDTVTGSDISGGRDVIFGNDGDDIISGLAGNDILRGGTGADTLTGGAGRDAFVFSIDDFTTPGTDVITDLSYIGGDFLVGVNLGNNWDDFSYSTIGNNVDFTVNLSGNAYNIQLLNYLGTSPANGLLVFYEFDVLAGLDHSDAIETIDFSIWEQNDAVSDTWFSGYTVRYMDVANATGLLASEYKFNAAGSIISHLTMYDDGNDNKLITNDLEDNYTWLTTTRQFNNSDETTRLAIHWDDGSYQSTDYDVVGSFIWSSTTYSYNTAINLISTKVINDDGNYSVLFNDAESNQLWVNYTDFYSDGSILKQKNIDYDDNSSFNQFFDWEANQLWTDYNDQYGTNNVLSKKIINYDDGSHSNQFFDWDSTKTWSDYTDTFGTNGVFSKKVLNYDDGSSLVQFNDWESNQAWVSYTDTLDTAGSLKQKNITYDDGSSSSYFNDWQSNQVWTAYADYYGTNGVFSKKTISYDDGTSSTQFFDWQSNQTWSDYRDSYSALAVIMEKVINYDDDTQIRTLYDHDTSMLWDTFVTWLDAADQTTRTQANWDDNSRQEIFYDVEGLFAWDTHTINYDINGDFVDEFFA